MQNTKHAPLPPNGTSKRYTVEVYESWGDDGGYDWERIAWPVSLDVAKQTRKDNFGSRITARDALGRKVIIKWIFN